jgi:AF2212-like protein
MTVRAIFEDGVFKPKTPLPLREHEEVEIDVKRVGETSSASDDDPTGWQAAQRFIGLWKDAPRRSDGSLSGDHDEVLYRRN